ncbi:MAG: response regulator transcription factor [Planctomycetes bacterium]|nr:response regulator transcription factor [Planctomycetota bacterium]
MSGNLQSTLLVMDHAIFRSGLATHLRAEGSFGEVRESQADRKGSSFAAGHDCLLLDAGTQGLNPVHLTRSLMADFDHPTCIIALFDGQPGSRETAQRMAQAGAVGMVDRNLAAADLLQALRRLRKVRPRPQAQVGGDAPFSAMTDEERLAVLSPREREVLEMVADGLTSREIAKELAIKPRTVEVHRHHILRKLGLRGIADLVKFAIRVGATQV